MNRTPIYEEGTPGLRATFQLPLFKGLQVGLALLAACGSASALEVKPVVNAQVLGGQYYYNGDESALGALASLTAAPYMKFNDRWSLVPLYSGSYRGTKQVQDLVGGGTLFQDSQNHVLSTKVIRTIQPALKLKAVGAYGFELLRETRDEDFGDGLYDNRRLSGGLEAEWFWSKEESVRFAYDHYRITFPNYQSLESQSDAGLGRELSQPNVLDNVNHALTVGTQARLPGKGMLELGLSQTFRAYGDQHIVAASGELTADTRTDSIQTFSSQVTYPVVNQPRWRLFSTLGYALTRSDSDQNSYDAPKSVFQPDFYDYMTHALSNNWTLLLGEAPWTVRMGGTLARQGYSDRRVQDAAGLYGTDTTHVDSAYLSLGLSYPIAKGFQLTATTAFGWNDSNNHYSRVYQYHYHTATYLMGFSYAY